MWTAFENVGAFCSVVSLMTKELMVHNKVFGPGESYLLWNISLRWTECMWQSPDIV